MDLKEILSIAGQPGLYKFVSQGRSGIIVESLLDQKRISVPATAKVSSMSDIAIFTDAEEVPLRIVLNTMKEKHAAEQAPEPKKMSDAELKAYFEAILPNYDTERVYLSDIKKVLTWYNLMQKNNIVDFDDKEEAGAEEASNADASLSEKAASTTKPKASKPARAASPKATSKAAGNVKVATPRKAQ